MNSILNSLRRVRPRTRLKAVGDPYARCFNETTVGIICPAFQQPLLKICSQLTMSTSLVCSSRTRVPLRFFHATARHYAAPNQEQTGDPKQQIIRRVLYPSNIRNRPTPIGTWRTDVGRAIQRAIPSKQAHETIERAWLLHKRHLRKTREEETARKFECMKKAMDVLHEIDSRLYMEANKKDDPRARTQEEMQMVKILCY